MKLLFWLVALPLIIVAALFAVANREPVTISLWPLADPFEVPLFIALIATLYGGVVLGGFVAWVSAGRSRRRARAEAKRATALERDNAALKARLETIEASRAAAGRAAALPAASAATPPAVPFLQ
jgi:lipopolysaccharide assembly protein A